MPSLPISAIILTYNEESNLAPCLSSLAGWVGELFIVDSGSTDATLAIAARFGAQVVTHPFQTHAQQWTWALENLPLQYEWILGLDADQRVTPELAAELADRFSTHPELLNGISGLFIKRRQIFRGHWIKHGGYYPKYLLKLFRRTAICLDENDLLDHHFYVNGATLNLEHDLIEDNRKESDISFWIGKHNHYAALHAREELRRRQNPTAWQLRAHLFGNPDERTAWLKRRWYTMPLYVRPFFYWVYRYFFLLGFLDGKQGFIFHFLQGFWYRLLVDIHLDDLLTQRVPQQPAAPAMPAITLTPEPGPPSTTSSSHQQMKRTLPRAHPRP